MFDVPEYVVKALRSFREGKPLLVHDSEKRENEVDIFIRASSVTVDKIRLMRKDGGGLLCVAIHSEIAKKLQLPFLHDILYSTDNEVLRSLVVDKLPYDKRSSFSITVNHRETRTGITDIDRALTVNKLGEMCKLYWTDREFNVKKYFINNFRAPGHVHLLRAADGLLDERKGHTELALVIALLAGVEPCVALIEMLGDDGKALSLERAKEYADKHGFYLLDGSIIEKIFESLRKKSDLRPIVV